MTPTPHDGLFRHAMSTDEAVRSLVRLVLPAAVVDEVRWQDIRREESTLTGVQLQPRQTDLLLSVPLQGLERPLLVYVLADHKSGVDRMAARQLFTYVDQIWNHFGPTMEAGRRVLPLVLPVILYHGMTPWTAPRNVRDLVDGPESLDEFRPSLPILIWDVWHDPEPDWRPEDDSLRAMVTLRKYGRSADLREHLPEIITRAVSAASPDRTEVTLTLVKQYVMTIRTDIQPVDLDWIVQQLYPMTPEPGSMLDRAEKEGEARGEARGRTYGAIWELEDLLQMPPSPAHVLKALTDAELGQRRSQLREKLERGVGDG